MPWSSPSFERDSRSSSSGWSRTYRAARFKSTGASGSSAVSRSSFSVITLSPNAPRNPWSRFIASKFRRRVSSARRSSGSPTLAAEGTPSNSSSAGAPVTAGDAPPSGSRARSMSARAMPGSPPSLERESRSRRSGWSGGARAARLRSIGESGSSAVTRSSFSVMTLFPDTPRGPWSRFIASKLRASASSACLSSGSSAPTSEAVTAAGAASPTVGSTAVRSSSVAPARSEAVGAQPSVPP